MLQAQGDQSHAAFWRGVGALHYQFALALHTDRWRYGVWLEFKKFGARYEALARPVCVSSFRFWIGILRCALL